MDITANLSGFADLEKALNSFSERTERQLVINSLRAGGRVIINHGADNAPVDDGLLSNRKSWMQKAGRYRPGQAIALKVATKGGKAGPWYAHLVEFGTSTTKAQPFFRPAFDEHPTDIIAAVAKAMARGIVRSTAE